MSVGWRPGRSDTVTSVLAELSTYCGTCDETGTIDDALSDLQIDCPQCVVDQTLCQRCSEGVMPNTIDLQMSGWDWTRTQYDELFGNYSQYYDDVIRGCSGAPSIFPSAGVVRRFWNRTLNGSIRLRPQLKSENGLTDLGKQTCNRSLWILCPEQFWRVTLIIGGTFNGLLMGEAVWTYAQIKFLGGQFGNSHHFTVQLYFKPVVASRVYMGLSQNFCEEVSTENLGWNHSARANDSAQYGAGLGESSILYQWAPPGLECFKSNSFGVNQFLINVTDQPTYDPDLALRLRKTSDPNVTRVSGMLSTKEEPNAIGSDSGTIPKGSTIDSFLADVLADCLGCQDHGLATTWANASADLGGVWVNDSNADGDTGGTYASISSGGSNDTLEGKYENLTPLPNASQKQDLDLQSLDVYYYLTSVSGLDVTLNVYVQSFGGSDHLIYTDTQSGAGTIDKSTTPQSIDMSSYWVSLFQILTCKIKFEVVFSNTTAGGEARIYKSKATVDWTVAD